MSNLLSEACIQIAKLEQLTAELHQRVESLERRERLHYGSDLHDEAAMSRAEWDARLRRLQGGK